MDDIDRLSLDFAIRHPDSFARILGRGEFDESERVLERLPGDRKAAIAARLPATHIRQLLNSERQRPADWLVDAPFDDAIDVLLWSTASRTVIGSASSCEISSTLLIASARSLETSRCVSVLTRQRQRCWPNCANSTPRLRVR